MLTLYKLDVYMYISVFIICIFIYLKRRRYISPFGQFATKKTLLPFLL